uniref:Uncharacterized protein n=1 Tax=Physcomitrium patens TaxID=3218 RepID=A0A2K1L3P8_PHYPA|nr:hypothetical protein PHYPA_003434 [Physcomitrium patens]
MCCVQDCHPPGVLNLSAPMDDEIMRCSEESATHSIPHLPQLDVTNRNQFVTSFSFQHIRKSLKLILRCFTEASTCLHG